jgi:hypothetical protein
MQSDLAYGRGASAGSDAKYVRVVHCFTIKRGAVRGRTPSVRVTWDLIGCVARQFIRSRSVVDQEQFRGVV